MKFDFKKNINYFSPKFFLFLFILLNLLLILLIFIIFYLQKIEDQPNISSEATKLRCASEAAIMSNNELAEQISNLKYPGEIIADIGVDRIAFAQKKLIEYLICDVKTIYDEKKYSSALEIINKLSMQESNKRNSLLVLERAYLGSKNLNYLLALGDIKNICPNVLPDVCLSVNVFGPDGEKGCRNMCAELNNLSAGMVQNIIKTVGWSDDPVLLKAQYNRRVALAYRINQSLAEEVCSYLPSKDKQEECLTDVNALKQMDDFKNDCHKTRGELFDLICLYPN